MGSERIDKCNLDSNKNCDTLKSEKLIYIEVKCFDVPMFNLKTYIYISASPWHTQALRFLTGCASQRDISLFII